MVSSLLVLAAGCAADGVSREPDSATQADSAAEPTRDADEPATTAGRDSAAHGTEDVGAVSGPGSELVRLGDRFPWCAVVQRRWDEQVQAQAQAEAARVAYSDAADTLSDVTDELDQAEVRQTLESAERLLERVSGELARAKDAVARLVHSGAESDVETEAIALERARDAYNTHADQYVQMLLAMAYGPTLLEPVAEPEESAQEAEADIEPLSFEDALAAIASRQDRVTDLAEAVRSASQEMFDALAAITDAAQASDAAAAFGQAQHAASVLEEAHREVSEVSNYKAVGRIQVGHEQAASDAVAAGETTHDEYIRRTGIVQEAIGALRVSSGAVLSEAIQYTLVTSNPPQELVATAVDLALADTAGMAAFWASLDESCLIDPDADTTSGASSQSTATALEQAPAQTSPSPDTEADCVRKIGRATTLATQWLNEAETVMPGDFNSATLAFDVAMLTYDDMQDANLAAYSCNLEREWHDEAERWAELATTTQNLKAELHYVCSTELEPRGFECWS